MSNRQPHQFLDLIAARLRSMEAEIASVDSKLVEQDIAARRIEADIGWEWAQLLDQIEPAVKAIGLTLDEWCKKALGVHIVTMRRRRRLHKLWPLYVKKRREAGESGQSGLMYAVYLVMDAERPNKRAITPNAGGTLYTGDIPGCQLVTGDSLYELRKIASQSAHQIVTSPPYWPAKRDWSGTIGLEETLEQYLSDLVAIFREGRRVLRDDGTLWINIGDSYAKSGGTWYGDPKRPASKGVKRQNSTYLLPAGNLLFIPERLAMALQKDGWICRSRVIWQKTAYNPESVTNRPTIDYEIVLILAKRPRHYYYDADMIRIPQKYPEVAKLKRVRRERLGGEIKPEGTGNDAGRSDRFFSNPLGRNAGCVWQVRPSSEYRGTHSATMPLELAERCILVGCPEGGTVLDCFGGAGTTALAALRRGRRAVSIEIDPKFAEEAHHRVANDLGIGGFALAAD